MRSQTAIYSKLVRDFMRTVPLAVGTGTTCGEAVARMTGHRASYTIIVDDAGRVHGIVTEQDVVRRVAFRVSPHTPVDEVMTHPVYTIPDDEYLYHAIGHMRRRGLRHMPAVDGDGVLAGMLDLHDALAVASQQMVQQIDRLTHEGTLDGVREVKAAQVELARELFADGVPAPEIQALLTHVNNDIYRRLTNLCLDDMRTQGWGEAPVAFCVIVMGSSGRGENYIYPDQDNGFVLADYPDAEHNRIDAFFTELADRLNTTLAEVGFPLCRGYCMAVNPLWRKTLSQWKQQITAWGRKRSVVAIRLSDIFFDFQPVWGERALAQELREHTVAMTRRNHPFLRQMFEEEADHNVALGLFGRFITEKDNRKHRGEINLKYTGTLPLVEAVRLLSLREGVAVTSTLGRIAALHEIGVLDAEEREGLNRAFQIITNLLLRQQVADFLAGRKVSNYVKPQSLSRHEKEDLLDAFRSVDSLRKRVRLEFTADVF